jgi:alpha-L-rhamnosidase
MFTNGQSGLWGRDKVYPDRSGQLLVTTVGAVGDGQTLNTKALQAAIDQLAVQGGGTIVVPPGEFLSGALFLKLGVNLHLEKGAVLRASTDMVNFPEQRTRIEGHFEEKFNPALINADGCDGLQITGEGTLDGDGRKIWDEFWERRNASKEKTNFKNLSVPRARLCLIENSKNVLIQGVTFKDSQFWNLHLYRCSKVLVEGVAFTVPDDYKQAPSSDGIDVDSCQDVTIKGCTFSVTDDCIAMKGSKGPEAMEDKESPPVERIRVSGCTFLRGHAMFTCGSEATVVRDVVVEDCEVMGWNDPDFDGGGAMPVLTLKLRPDTPQLYENITVRNITVDSGGARIFSIDKWTQYFDLKGRPEPVSRIDKITVSGIKGRVGSLGTIRGNGKTGFGEILLKDVDVQSKEERLKIDKGIEVKIENVHINGRPFSAGGSP